MEQQVSKLGCRIGKTTPVPMEVIMERLNIKPINALGMPAHERKAALAEQQRQFILAMKSVREHYKSNPLIADDEPVNTEYTNDGQQEVDPVN